MKNITRYARRGGRFGSLSAFLVVVFCLLTTTNPLHAQWIATSNGPGGNVSSFAISGTNLFAGTNGSGVFLSTNSGTNWAAVNSGLTYTTVRALAVSGTNLFAGTDYGGVWRRPLSEMITDVAQGGSETPTTYALRQNYPNPFNPSTTIRYGLPQRSHVRLTVFNTLGQEVAELVNGEVEAGYHEVQFDASALSSGVYIYRLRAGDFVQSRKLVALK